jgi:6-phosphogluconate dehydrogenase
MTHPSPISDIAMIGLGVMGKNLALNIADHGYHVAVFDLDKLKVKAAINQEAEERASITGGKKSAARMTACDSLKMVLDSLAKPRVIVLSVPAGAPVDGVCQSLIEAGIEACDIVIDTGNSLWTDTVAREAQ